MKDILETFGIFLGGLIFISAITFLAVFMIGIQVVLAVKALMWLFA